VDAIESRSIIHDLQDHPVFVGDDSHTDYELDFRGGSVTNAIRERLSQCDLDVEECGVRKMQWRYRGRDRFSGLG
jgi:hypothetical protein